MQNNSLAGNIPVIKSYLLFFLGYVHGGQPTVIFRVGASFSVNAWICPRRSTDRDLERLSASFCENAWICPRRATDRDLQSVSAMKKVNAWICAHQSTDLHLESASAIKKRGECLDMRTLDNRP